jgi:serine/threonine-protein kinase
MDRDTFLANVRKSGLAGKHELRAALADAAPTHRGRVVARTLVEKGLLTKFQAELLLVGRTNGFFLGQYRILDQLGQGGMGRVFKAVHQTMNRVVALKVLAPVLVKTAKAEKLFQREVRAAARLTHPNIVTAYDANQIGGRHYLVMEFVDGPNLDQLVRQQGPLPVSMACEIVRQAANGLQYAHEMGMVHRDIKPANLLLQRSGQQAPAGSFVLKILDFGLARLHDAGDPSPSGSGSVVSKQNTVMGTPDFLSPEQGRNLPHVDIRSDLYSLGCTFYYLLAGKVPFPGGATLEKLIRHSSAEPTPLEELRPEVPAAVAGVVRRLMAKDQNDRFQTPAELAAALAPFAAPSSTSWTGSALPSDPSLPSGDLTPDAPMAPMEGAENTSALAGTFPPAFSPTPFSGESQPLPWSSEQEPATLRTVFYGALGVMSLVLLGGLAFLLWRLLE